MYVIAHGFTTINNILLTIKYLTDRYYIFGNYQRRIGNIFKHLWKIKRKTEIPGTEIYTKKILLSYYYL